MVNKTKEIYLIAKSGKVLFLLPIAFALIVPPAIIFANIGSGIELTRAMYVGMTQTLLPFGVVMWCMAFLQIWIDNDGEEILRASSGKRSLCPTLICLVVLYLFVGLPGHLLATYYQVTSIWEFLRLIAIYVCAAAVLYFVALILRSVTLAAMFVFIFLVLGILPFSDLRASVFTIIKPTVLASVDNFLNYYLYVFLAGVLLSIAAVVFEKKFFRFK